MHPTTARGLARWAIVLAAMLCVSAASAETNGVKVGDGRLHPSLGLESEYDSLVLVMNDGTSYGDLVMHVLPGLSYSTGSDSLQVSLAAIGDWNLYTGLVAPGTRSLSYFGGDANLNLVINPKGSVGVVVGDQFSHGDRVSAVDVGIGVRSVANDAFVKVPIRPGGGALEITPGYTLSLENFLGIYTLPNFAPGALNYLSHRPSLDVRWKFLPKTAIVLQVEGDIRQYGDTASNPSVSGLYARTGISGLVTPKIALLLTAGYGNAFADQSIANYQSVIGQAEFSYIMSETSRLRAGYIRTFEPVPQFGWYGDNRGYFAGSFLLGGRLLLDIRGTYDLLDYAPGAFGARVDSVLGTDETVTYKAAEWLDVAAGHSLSFRASSLANATGALAANNYNRNQIFARVTVRY